MQASRIDLLLERHFFYIYKRFVLKREQVRHTSTIVGFDYLRQKTKSVPVVSMFIRTVLASNWSLPTALASDWLISGQE